LIIRLIFIHDTCLHCFNTEVWWQEGHPACIKMGGWWRWALLSPDGVAPCRMVCVSASVDLPLHHKVQKFSSGAGSPGWFRKSGRKTVVMWWWLYTTIYSKLNNNATSRLSGATTRMNY